MGSGLIKAAAAAVVGRSHVKTGTPCQDAVAVSRRRHATCIALSDGAGSKRRSEVGARIATETVSNYAAESFDQLFALVEKDSAEAGRRLLCTVLTALRRKNRRKRAPIDSMACTLLFFACKDERYLAGHIGDGVIGCCQGDQLIVLSKPENGEYSNSTYFVTDPTAPDHFRVYAGKAEPRFGAVLMSDGTAESLYEKSSGRLAVAVRSLLEWAEDLPPKRMELVLKSNLEKVFRTKSADDCSLALLTFT